MKSLTENAVKNTKAPAKGKIELSDAAMPGLRLRVLASGRKSWIFEKRISGTRKKRTLTLGTYGTAGLSLKEARSRAAELSKEMDGGVDVVAERRAAQAAAERRVTVAEALERYDAAELAPLRRGAERRRQLDQALADYMTQPLEEIERSHIREMINARRTGKNGQPTPVMAERIRAALSAFFTWASTENDERDAILHSNPFLGLAKSKSKDGNGKRDRLLSRDELAAIWRASAAMGDTWGPMIRLLLLTAQRRSIILALPWEEVDFDGANIVTLGERTKNKMDDTTPLSTLALSELHELHTAALEARRKSRKRGDPHGFVFTTTGRSAISGVSKAKKRLDALVMNEMGEHVDPWTWHDFRRAFSTHMNEITSGRSRYVIDRAINHTPIATSGAEGHYKVWQADEMLEDRRRLFETWAGIVTGAQSDNVVSFAGAGK